MNATTKNLRLTRLISHIAICDIISESINQKILENKKSTYGDSFCLITGKKNRS